MVSQANSGSSQILGPILSVSDISLHEDFFVNSLGFTSTGKNTISQVVTSGAFGVESASFLTTFIESPANPFGVRLWQFDPVHPDTVRDLLRGTDRDALKVIDFYAPDFSLAIESLKNDGYEPDNPTADYELHGKSFQESHYWRPDNIVCAVISGPQDFFRDFVTTTDRLFSEPQSISSPVSDLTAALEFYREVFDMHPLYEYKIKNSSFDSLVGSEKPIDLLAINVGTSLQAPYLGLIDYGHDSGQSLRGNSKPPIRGLLGIEVLVSSVANIHKVCCRSNGKVLVEPTEIFYPPIGEVISCLIEGPHGVIHHILEKLTTQ